jgi:hypothetical protein
MLASNAANQNKKSQPLRMAEGEELGKTKHFQDRQECMGPSGRSAARKMTGERGYGGNKPQRTSKKQKERNS